MEILIITNARRPNDQDFLLKHAQYWQEKGHNINYLTLKGAVSIKRSKTEDSRLGILLRLKLLNTLLSPFRREYDLVVENWTGFPYLTPLFTKTKKLVISNRNPNKVFKTLISKIYKQTHFLTTTDDVRKSLQQYGFKPENIILIRNGVAAKTSPYNNQRKYITALGVLNKEDARLVVDTFALVERREVSWKYRIMAEKRLHKTIKTMLGESGMGKKTEIIGNSNKYLSKGVGGSYLAFVPKKFEGWFEAFVHFQANDVPLVVASHQSFSKFIKNNENGICVEPNAFAAGQAILTLINDSKAYLKLAKNASRRALKYTWEASTAKSLEYIETL
jgi:glycosyltransferase involved in cell wall biosynthesis